MSAHVKADIPSYVNGDLSESRTREIEAHLEECEKCRAIATKAKAKHARIKRQSQRKGGNEKVPNLLLTRLSRDAGLDRPQRRGPWLGITLFLLFLLCVAWWVRQRYWQLSTTAEAPVSESTTTLAGVGYDVSASSAGTTPVGTPGVVPSTTTATPPIPEEWAAPDSRVREFRPVVVRGRVAWRSLWNELGQSGVAPRVDFNTMLVVGILAGNRPVGAEVSVYRPREDENEIVIPYRVSGSSVTVEGAPVVRPFVLRTLPRSGKRVRFESL